MGATYKNNIELTIFGESHGKAIGITIGNLPSGIQIDLDEVARDMKRRAPGQNKMSTARKEADQVEILSGLQDGITTGAPLTGVIYNSDQHSIDYSLLKTNMRPGHSDYPAYIKYKGFNDVRGGGHFSGRITAPIVFAGNIAKQILKQKGIVVEKAFINDAAGNSRKPVSGTYKFGLYNNAGGSGSPLDTVSITYSPGDTEAKTAKFKNLDLNTTYYVFELDDKNQPIKDSSRVAIVNGMEYFTSYTTTKNGATESNSATNGDTVTVTNQSRVNKLPSTGSCGVLIYRLAGVILILFAGVLMLMKYKETKTRN